MTSVVLTGHMTCEEHTARTVFLREISGEEELGVNSAKALIQALIISGGTVATTDLTLSDEDMVMAAIYRMIYGNLIECHITCQFCERRFETSFGISDWVNNLLAGKGAEVQRRGNNLFSIGPENNLGHIQFRLPTGADLISVSGKSGSQRTEALRKRCVVEGDPNDPRLEAAMAWVGPLLDDDIEAQCPYCGLSQSFAFCLSDYLLAAITRERPIVLREVHYLACAYHWSRAEILAMPRSMRRDHVRMVLADVDLNRRVVWR